MCEQSGHHFDPELMEVFKGLFDQVDALQQHLGDEPAPVKAQF
jgi:HD-GYP domain-containing protein (c-di-GMP phosphodiesterase class II)